MGLYRYSTIIFVSVVFSVFIFRDIRTIFCSFFCLFLEGIVGAFGLLQSPRRKCVLREETAGISGLILVTREAMASFRHREARRLAR